MKDIYNHLLKDCPTSNNWWLRTSEEYAVKRILTEFLAIWAGEPLIDMTIKDEDGFEHPLYHKYIEHVDFIINNGNKILLPVTEIISRLDRVNLVEYDLEVEKEEVWLLKHFIQDSQYNELARISRGIRHINGY